MGLHAAGPCCSPSWRFSTVQAYVNDVMTVPANMAGLPALSLPVATTRATYPGGASAEIPVGMQLLARPFDEAMLLRVGSALEDAAAFRSPPHVTTW